MAKDQPTRPCSVPECPRPAGLRRGFCHRHYRRWLKGSLEPANNSRDKDINARLWSKTTRDNPDGCWLWTAAVNNKGYGTTAYPRQGEKKRPVYAHRLAWEETHGAIPDGLAVDHICHQTRCINPAHLRLATYSQNQENRKGASSNSATGHLNVYPRPGGGYVVQVRRKTIGSFADLGEAIEAAAAARRVLMPFTDPAARIQEAK